MRFLFCLPTLALSGGVKVIFQLAHRLQEAGESVAIFSYAKKPSWFLLKTPLIAAKDFETIPFADYDFVVVSHSCLIPSLLTQLGRLQKQAAHHKTRGVFFCQEYESFDHAKGDTYAEYLQECPAFVELYKLPVPIITPSRSIQNLIRERIGRDSYYMPVGLDKSLFRPRPVEAGGGRQATDSPQRVLMVGNYLLPFKGMKDGFEALRRLSLEMPVQLVLVTQENRHRRLLENLPFPVELHYRPGESDMPAIITSCDVYCCASWYEGLGLPSLEAFACGVPVVSTRNYGVTGYGEDNVNLLLARPNDPGDLYEKLKRLLREPELAARLRQAGLHTVQTDYDWDTSREYFQRAIADIRARDDGPGQVDATAMQALLHDLELAGYYTPIAISRRFQELSKALNSLCQNLLAVHILSESDRSTLVALRDNFKQYLGNPDAEYYDVFKAKYDLCQVILSLRDDKRFAEYLHLILTRQQQSESKYPRENTSGEQHIGNLASPAFSEIRYREP